MKIFIHYFRCHLDRTLQLAWCRATTEPTGALRVGGLQQQCLVGVPQITGEVVSGDPNELPVYIEADRAWLNQPTNAIYEGNVDMKQGNRHLVTEYVKVDQEGEGENIQRCPLSSGDLIIKIIKLRY